LLGRSNRISREAVSHCGSEIRDDKSNHALRIRHDCITGVIRLEAAVSSGSLKKLVSWVLRCNTDLVSSMPVWTAFITHHITSPSWMRRRSGTSNVVLLADLDRRIFTSEYKPVMDASGAHKLDFILHKGNEHPVLFRKLILRLSRCGSL
jgi:hypothetical protein